MDAFREEGARLLEEADIAAARGSSKTTVRKIRAEAARYFSHAAKMKTEAGAIRESTKRHRKQIKNLIVLMAQDAGHNVAFRHLYPPETRPKEGF